ncbi:MAG: repressor LexA [Treponema sp.]|nr:repressor LexA [Treponema sp.]MBR7080967.1 repressor LexA [Treponema sp.]
MKNLTDRQREVLIFIAQFTEDNVYPPTVREIGEHFGISLRAVQDHVAALQKKGYLSQSQKRSRSIRVLKDVRPKVVAASAVLIPVINSITPGKPALSEENFSSIVTCSFPFVENGKKYFLFQVTDNSMIDIDIRSGDQVFVEIEDNAQNGQIVVVALDDEITIRRFYKEANRICLKSENSQIPPSYYQEVKILGIVSGIYRKLAND